MKSLKEADIKKGMKVLVRCDFNCPIDDNGNITEDYRINAALPTIKYLIEKEAKIILMSHLGEPGGQVIERLRLDEIRDKLSENINSHFLKAPDCIGEEVKKMINEMAPGKILLLENLRFHKGENENDEMFAKEISSLGDIFINDAFGTCHRKHASIVSLPKFLPSFAGFLVEMEVDIMSRILKDPKRPLVSVFGGAKIETKIPAIKKFLRVADRVLIGGKIAIEAKFSDSKIYLPEDFDEDKLDIGPKTIKKFKEIISKAKTIVWNGPMGYFEKERFETGTREIAEAIAKSSAFKVIGGGQTSFAVSKYGLMDKIDFNSTGGGAMLDFLAYGTLPGLEVLNY